MLYATYQAQSDALTPVRLIAQMASGILGTRWPLLGDLPLIRHAAAAFELVSRFGISHRRPPFGLAETVVDGRPVGVAEEVALATPFCSLLHFAKKGAEAQPRVLLVAPLSGHFATLLRGTV